MTKDKIEKLLQVQPEIKSIYHYGSNYDTLKVILKDGYAFKVNNDTYTKIGFYDSCADIIEAMHDVKKIFIGEADNTFLAIQYFINTLESLKYTENCTTIAKYKPTLSQDDMVIQEMAELNKAILKLRIDPDSKNRKDNLIEEAGDVLITVLGLINRMDIAKEVSDSIIDKLYKFITTVKTHKEGADK